jgi:LysM repeat protein
MKWRHWSILIVLLLLNYIIFSTALTQLSRRNQGGALPTRTPRPTFQSVDPSAVSWIVLPTSTPLPTRTPITPMPTEAIPPTAEITSTMPVMDTPVVEVTETTAAPPEATASHTVAAGETLTGIAAQYGVTLEAIMEANGLADPSLIMIGQVLVIPAPAEVPATATPTPEPQPTDTPKPAATKAPAPKPTKKPPTATPKPTARGKQFTAQLNWDVNTAPNCAGPGISKESMIRDGAGNPLNGVRVEVNCYGNLYHSQPSGTPGEYEPGRYGFAFGQTSPQALTCTAYILDGNGQPLASSQVVTLAFDTNDCKPGGSGHQVATLNWTKHW